MDQTHRPLEIPTEFANYAEKFRIFDMFKRLLSTLIINKPTDPLNFIIDYLQQDDDDVPQIMIVGPPASGKRSIANMLCKQFGTQHITKENILKDGDEKLIRQVEDLTKNSENVPADLLAKLIKSRLDVYDAAKKGWVMDGIITTREQVHALAALGHSPKHCVILDAPDSVLIERASGKRLDPLTGDVYHVTFEMPSSTEIYERLESEKDFSESKLVEDFVNYHRNIDGIRSSYESCYKIINADQPKSDIFSQVMTFVCKPIRSPAPTIPRIILLGPYGSGKTFQAKLLAKKYKLAVVSSEELVKESIADDTPVGQTCKAMIDRNVDVPDNILLDLVVQKLDSLATSAFGWVLHGFPKNRELAEELDAAQHLASRVYFFDIPNDAVMERMAMRATDPVTGDRLHLLYNPPRTNEIKDRLQTDPKDCVENVHEQLMKYRALEDKLREYYEDAVYINAEQDSHRVFESIESQLVNPLPKCKAPDRMY